MRTSHSSQSHKKAPTWLYGLGILCLSMAIGWQYQDVFTGAGVNKGVYQPDAEHHQGQLPDADSLIFSDSGEEQVTIRARETQLAVGEAQDYTPPDFAEVIEQLIGDAPDDVKSIMASEQVTQADVAEQAKFAEQLAVELEQDARATGSIMAMDSDTLAPINPAPVALEPVIFNPVEPTPKNDGVTSDTQTNTEENRGDSDNESPPSHKADTFVDTQALVAEIENTVSLLDRLPGSQEDPADRFMLQDILYAQLLSFKQLKPEAKVLTQYQKYLRPAQQANLAKAH